VVPLSALAAYELTFPQPRPRSANHFYPSESAWLAFVATTATGSLERGFVDWVDSNYPAGINYRFYTIAEAELFYDPALHNLTGGALGGSPDGWYFYNFTNK
jgi:hypothetical protein